MELKKKIARAEHATSAEKGTYASFFVGQNIVYQLVSLGLMTYWTAVLGINAAIAGLIMMLSRFWDAVNDPILAGVIAKTGKTKHGKYRPWLFVSAFLLPLFLVVIFAAPFGGGNDAGTITWAILSYLVFWMVYTITDVPIFSMSVSMEPDLRRRTKILLIGRMAAAFAGIIVAALYNYVLVQNASINNFLYMGIGLAVLSMILMIPIVLIRERNEIKDQKVPTLKIMFTTVFKNKHLLKLMVVMIVQRLFFGALTIQSYLVLNAAEGISFINIQAWQAVLISVLGSILNFLVTVGLAKFLMRFGTRKSILVMEIFGLILLVAAGIPTFYSRNVWAYFVFGQGLVFIMLAPSVINKGKLTAECIEYNHYLTGRRDESIGFAAQTFIVKLGSGVSAFIVGAIVAGLGYDGALAAAKLPQKDGVLEKIFWLIFIAGALVAVFNIIGYLFIYNLRTENVQIMGACNKGLISKEMAEAEIKKPFKERNLQALIAEHKKIQNKE